MSQTKRVAVLIEQGVEDSEFQIPRNALERAGAEVTVLGSRVNETYAGKNKVILVKADRTTTDARAEEFDAVIIPGGMAPDKMRTNMKTVRFVRDAFEGGKLVAAVCHGPQVLIEGDMLKGKRATGFRSIRKDMQNAGAVYENAALVEDGNLITSRRPSDLPIFATAVLRRLGLAEQNYPLPEVGDMTAEWWTVAERWGGQSKPEIVAALNTAIRGERYALTAFEKYAEAATDSEAKALLGEILTSKRRHLQMLEGRLATLGGELDMQSAGSGAWATLKSWFQGADDAAILRRAMGDLQTGVVDTFNLTNQTTDPVTASLFDEIEVDLARHEQQVAELYHGRFADSGAKPASPSTGAAVSA